MKLSILIPMYNAQDNIGNCLDSLINQNLPKADYEIVVMDDGSKDNSVAIVEDYKTKHGNIQLYKEKNSGCYSTRNKLLKLARGEYIYNLDADDYIVHNCLSNLLKIASKHSLDLICFKTHETKKFNQTTLETPFSNNDFNIFSGRALIEKEWKIRYEIWWFFIKRSFLEENQMTFNNNEYNADVVFTLQALLNAKQIAYLPIRIHRYVQTEDSLMRSSDFSIIKKRLIYVQMMIGNLSKIINSLKNETSSYNAKVIDNLSHRRDIFTFFHILNMVKHPFELDYIKKNIKTLKSVNAYPIKNFFSEEYHSFKYKILLCIVNKPKLLFTAIRFKIYFIIKNSNKR